MADKTTIIEQEIETPQTEEVTTQVPNTEGADANVDNQEGGNEENETIVNDKEEPKEIAVEEKADPTVDILSKYNLSEEDLKQFSEQKAKQREEEEKPLQEQKKWSSIVNFGIANKILKKEDVLSYEEAGKKTDTELAFEKFKNEYKPSEEGLSNEELQEEIQYEFQNEYPNEKVIKLEANAIREQLSIPFKSAESTFNKVQSVEQMKAQHKKIFNEVASAPIQDTIEFDGKKIDIEYNAEITEEEVAKALQSNEGSTLLNYMHDISQNNSEVSSQIYKGFIQNLKKEKSQKNAIWEKAIEYAKENLTIGAKAPFGKNIESQKTKSEFSESDFYTKNILKN
jgi:hypothetical protein